MSTFEEVIRKKQELSSTIDNEMVKKMSEVEYNLNEITEVVIEREDMFGVVEERVTNVEEKLKGVADNFTSFIHLVDQRLESVNLDALDERVSSHAHMQKEEIKKIVFEMEKTIMEQFEKRLSSLENAFKQELKGIYASSSNQASAQSVKPSDPLDRKTASKNAFYFYDGSIARSINELRSIVEESADSLFSNHMGEGRNDFADWIRNVFHNYELAHKIEQAKTKEEFLRLF